MCQDMIPFDGDWLHDDDFHPMGSGMMLCTSKLMGYLEDHPMTRKWLLTMVIVSPLTGGCGTPSKWPKWLVNGGYYLLTNWDDPPSRAASSSSGFHV